MSTTPIRKHGTDVVMSHFGAPHAPVIRPCCGVEISPDETATMTADHLLAIFTLIGRNPRATILGAVVLALVMKHWHKGERVGLKELIELTGAKKSTVHDRLVTLLRLRYIKEVRMLHGEHFYVPGARMTPPASAEGSENSAPHK